MVSTPNAPPRVRRGPIRPIKWPAGTLKITRDMRLAERIRPIMNAGIPSLSPSAGRIGKTSPPPSPPKKAIMAMRRLTVAGVTTNLVLKDGLGIGNRAARAPACERCDASPIAESCAESVKPLLGGRCGENKACRREPHQLLPWVGDTFLPERDECSKNTLADSAGRVNLMGILAICTLPGRTRYANICATSNSPGVHVRCLYRGCLGCPGLGLFCLCHPASYDFFTIRPVERPTGCRGAERLQPAGRDQ